MVGRRNAESSGKRRGGCHLSVSVSLRTRSRSPTPSRHSPGRRVKGKISGYGGALYVGFCFIRLPSLERAWLNALFFLLFAENMPFSTLYSAPICEGKPCINALVPPPACLRAAGPPGISSRDSLPALNAMPGVQALRPVQCVRRDGRLWHLEAGKVSRAAGHKQPEFTSAVKRHARRASSEPCTVCPERRAVVVLGRGMQEDMKTRKIIL